MTKICVPQWGHLYNFYYWLPAIQQATGLLILYTKLCLAIKLTIPLVIMSSDDGVNSRKRRLEIDDEGTTSTTTATSRATQAQENKRRQIQQSSWGFREVLVECGLLEFATNGSGDGESFFDCRCVECFLGGKI